MAETFIKIRGAREHNLKGVSLDIPRNKLVVITGLSGSGKSSLAFDTIYAEGQRRYLESLSSYARQFLEKMKKPEVDYISGLSPSISIEQRSITHNPRSTVATVTEIYDYLRLLFAKAGEVHCHLCGAPVTSQRPDEIAAEILKECRNEEIQVMAPVVRGRKGEFQKLFQDVLKKGYSVARIDGKETDLKPELKLRKTHRHDIEILMDHFAASEKNAKRLLEAVTAAAELSEGSVRVFSAGRGGKALDRFFSTKRSCLKCQTSYPDFTPNMFSFNSPYGACPKCKGLGKYSNLMMSGLIKDEDRPLLAGALSEEIFFSFNKYFIEDLLHDLIKAYHFEAGTPFKDWPEAAKEAFFWGDGEHSGLIEELERLFHETNSEEIRQKVRKFLREDLCGECGGKRLRKESLGVKIQGKSIVELTEQAVEKAGPFFDKLEFSARFKPVTQPILKEIRQRLKFLLDIGLSYLTLDRTVATLAGGELQRIRLAAQIGVGLTGVLYVLDEPSIGLHPRDNSKLITALEKLRDLKNTVLVVEHDEETMRRADYLIDMGPGAGRHGGEVVAEGPVHAIKNADRSLTMKYLSGELKIEVPEERKSVDPKNVLEIRGCREHNLKQVNVKIPLGLLICVTGVSGSGKSTLIYDTLYKEMHNRIWNTSYSVGKFASIKGAEKVDKVIAIDQAPIGRTPRSNPATYTDLFGLIRKLFSEVHESRARRYTPSRFSFNLKGGRCEICRGEGFKKLQMSFMPDIYVQCETCRGRRYNDQTLEVRYRGKNISEVLDLSVSDAIEFFSEISFIRERLELLQTIGLGYLTLGQPSTTLSGGEAQRIKLAFELSKKSTGKTLYLLDEPTTGLHFADIENLLKALFRLREQGNTVIVIEHNLDVIKMADHLIDLGPEGGEGGGRILAAGTPEEIAALKDSYTGRFLKDILKVKVRKPKGLSSAVRN